MALGTRRRDRRNERGNAIVEFAVAVPFLMVVMLGITEISRYAYTALLVSSAARAGAQYGARNQNTAQDTASMTAAAQKDGAKIPIPNPTYDPGSPSYYCWDSSTGTETANASATCASGTLVEYISYTVSGTLTPLFNYFALPKTLPVSSTATLRVCLQAQNCP